MYSWRIVIAIAAIVALVSNAIAYPPAVSIMGQADDCLTCHVNNGPWIEDDALIIDILDKETRQSLKQPDGSFLIEVSRNDNKTVLCVIGRMAKHPDPPPFRNGWIFFDPKMVDKPTLSKFLPGWEVNATYGCRLVGDKLDLYPGAALTVTSMTVKPTEKAGNGIITWMPALTAGDPPKGKPAEGMLGNFYEYQVKLRIE
jgi:hypothetical protein